MDAFLEELILAEDEQAFFACLSRHYGRPIGFQELETLDGAAVYRRLYQLQISQVPEDHHQTILRRFLLGRCDVQDMPSRFKTQGSYYQVAVLTGGTTKERSRQGKLLLSLVEDGDTVAFQTHQAFLFHFRHGPVLPAKAEALLAEQLASALQQLFFSYPFPHLARTPTFYEQALLASQLLNTERLVYVDQCFMPLLLAGFENQKLLTSLIHPQLLRLYDHDRTHHTSFYRTMEVYLDCQRDIQKTIDRLHIGRSTLFYRFTKIGELLGEDFYQLDFFAYQLSLAIIHFKEGGGANETLTGALEAFRD